MKPEVNAVLQEVKANLANPQPKVDVNALRLPDFKAMSIMESAKWCIENGITKAPDIAQLTGKQVNTIHTAMWKLRNPKRVKVLQRRAKKAKALKAGIVKEGVKATKVKKPKITNGQYEDGMETPYRDAIMRRGVFPSDFVAPKSLEKARQWLAEGATKTTNIHNELMTENHRLKILIEHYESLLFKGGK
jgi:hypothetical protein